MFNKFDHKITIKSILIKTVFLDVEIDLKNKTYDPFTNQTSKLRTSI